MKNKKVSVLVQRKLSKAALEKMDSSKAVHPSFAAFQLATLAIAIANWKDYREPAFLDAEKVLADAHQHLSGNWQIRTLREYEMKKEQALRPPIPGVHIPSIEDSIELIEQTLRDEEPHPAVEEPKRFPARRSMCLRLITKEKDRKRRALWLRKAGVPELGSDIRCAQDYRKLASRLVRHIPKFGAKYPPRQRAALPRDEQGRFMKANVRRGDHGRVKKIARRNEKGQIKKNLPPS